jgi:ribonuclease HI
MFVYFCRMAKKQKFYVVWEGKQPGIYTKWEDCKKQIHNVPGARYKSFEDRELAELAYGGHYKDYYETKQLSTVQVATQKRIPDHVMLALAVDAACAGNPGKMEYRGMFIETRQEIFKSKVFESGTNNIGEFLAIVHALAWLAQKNLQYPIYSDSAVAILWVKARKCRTKHTENKKNSELFQLIARAEHWLNNNQITVPVLKWDTEKWGEIVADYQRK